MPRSIRDLFNGRLFPLLMAGLVLCLVFQGCSLFEDDDSQDPEAWIALTAVYDEVRESGAPIQRIVLVNFYRPSSFKVLTPDSVTAAERPRISRDRKKIVFEHHITGLGSRPFVVQLERDTGRVEPLYASPQGGEKRTPLLGTLDAFVWNPDSRGFYASMAVGPALGIYTYFYDILNKSFEPISRFAEGVTVAPYGLKGTDSLFVLSSDEAATGSSLPGFYFMDAETGEYLACVKNEHLQFAPKEGDPGEENWSGWKRSVFNPSYHEAEDLILFELHEDSPVDAPPAGQGFTVKLAVTNLSGTYFRELTSGEDYLDRYPRWGPDDTILFDRVRPGNSGGLRGHRVMVLNFKTGTPKELVDPSVIDGAVALRFPDY